mmetsp:Transcript_5080/g.12116  ORF Transcript_5080/g.12116 Transcript_5080/m.12116 type:complete len:363 (-) Transcript_5080:194-1282(-)
MQELGNLFKVRFDHLTGGQSRGTDTDTSGGDSRSVSWDAVLVQSNADGVAGLFVFGSSDLLGLEVPQDQVVFGTARGDGVSQRSKLGGKCGGVLLDLLGVDFELGSHDFLELGGNTGNLVFVWSSLKGREDGLVDFSLKSTSVLAEEDHTSTGSTKGLVGGSGDNVADFKGRSLFASGDQSRNVSHIHHQQGTVGIGNFTEFSVVPVTWVGGSTSNDKSWLEETGMLSQLFVVDQSSFRADTVGKGFKVDRSRRNGLTGSLLLGVGVESVSQVTTTGQVQSHDTVVWSQQGSVNGKVGWRSRVWLDIDTPLFRVQSVCLQSTLLAEFFHLIDNFVSPVVTSMWKTFGVFVGQSRSQTVNNGL